MRGKAGLEGLGRRCYLGHVPMKSKHCRVCGQRFRSVRFDAQVCSSTCARRKNRGHDLAYLATLPPG
jgi:predicted nucleic acid-binding Zn ribbon protein